MNPRLELNERTSSYVGHCRTSAALGRLKAVHFFPLEESREQLAIQRELLPSGLSLMNTRTLNGVSRKMSLLENHFLCLSDP